MADEGGRDGIWDRGVTELGAVVLLDSLLVGVKTGVLSEEASVNFISL